MKSTRPPALEVRGLSASSASGARIVEDVSLQVLPGEILGIVGESGSGKTTTAMAILGYSAPGVVISSGEIRVSGERIDPRSMARRVRGRLISYVPQSSGTALNPSLRVASAISDMIAQHRIASDRGDDAASLLATVGLPNDRGFQARYPHQLSGGQQQRVCIAVALAAQPRVVVLDEPTTGLDVVTQALILKELLRLRDSEHVSMIYVTHDLSVVAQIADRIAVMNAGRIVEEGRTDVVLRRPRHPYSRGLVASIPDHARPHQLRSLLGIGADGGRSRRGCAFVDRCPQHVARCQDEAPPLSSIGTHQAVRCFEWQRTPTLDATTGDAESRGRETASKLDPALIVEHLAAEHRSLREHTVAAHDVSFTLRRGECVALVGESGSGKTTIARTIAGLHPIAGGRVVLAGEAVDGLARRRSVEQRRRVQLVSQNPSAALNPRHTVENAIARPAQKLRGLSKKDARAEVRRLLEAVRLPERLAHRYPAELSGGERQRVAIARALATLPEILICDEITSSLDVSVQAAVLALLGDLRRQFGLSLLFITHDLGVVAAVADHVLVLEQGIVCEEGPTSSILRAPAHPYTRRLLEAAPSISAVLESWDEPDRLTDEVSAVPVNDRER
jgi:peptide/nickel transport system ATP-binding protein